MSMTCNRKLDELKREAENLGLKVKIAGNKETKTDYIIALRNFYLLQKYGDKIPTGLGLMLKIDGVMLASQSKHLSKAEMDALWADGNNVVGQEKIDGVRLVSFWSPDRTEWDKFSRNISVSDFLPVSYQDNIYTPNIDESKITHRFLLDSELTAPESISTVMGKRGCITETQLQSVGALLAMEGVNSIKIQKDELMGDSDKAPLKFNAFDILWIDGEWVIDKPYIERFKLVKMVVEELKEAGVNVEIPRTTYNNKKAFYKKIIANNGEGIILKDVRAKYMTGANRTKAMIKVKRTASESMGDSVDAFVTGYQLGTKGTANENIVSALEFSTYIIPKDGSEPYLHVIANIAGLPMDLKNAMTEFDENGIARLKQEYYGRVAELDGQNISARAKSLQHAVLVCWRPDKNPDLACCQMTEEFLDSQIF